MVYSTRRPNRRAWTTSTALSAFMWLPAVLERDAVQFRNVASGT